MNKSNFTKELKSLVKFNTLTGNFEENKNALDFIQSKITKQAFVKRIKNSGTEYLVASNSKTKSPDICFLVHVDVVAAKPNQFNLVSKGNKTYGRGVSDMKFSIPMGYSLLNEIIESEQDISFSFVVTTDEETGGFLGAKHLVDTYGLRPKLLIVPDGGDDFVFINRSKGVCGIRIDARGIPAHSSRVWLGKNAIEPLVILCGEIIKKYKSNNKKESWNTTVNIGKFQGGISTNQVCSSAFVMLDFRFPETSSVKKILKEVKGIAQKIDRNLSVSVFSSGEPTFVEKNNPDVQMFIKSFEEILGKKIEVKGAFGASDARYFSKLGVPILMIKPEGGDIHGDNEFININSCMLFYKALLNFVKRFTEKYS